MVSRRERGRGGGEGEGVCTLEGSNSRRRGDEGRFCAVVKAAVLAAFGNSEGRERGGREKGNGV